MEDSLLRDFTVRLDKEEVQLMKELDSVQEKISKLDPEQVHKQMLEALQQEAINSIAVALDISDVLEDRPESNSIFHKDVSLLKSNKKELDERKKGYVRSRLTGSDFMAGVKRIETSAKNPDGSIIHVDCYTGEPLVAGRVEDKYDHEHVISAKELSESYFTGLFLSEEEIRAFANSDKNLKVTKAGINRSKGDEDLKKWLSKEHPGKPGVSNQEYYNIDPEIATKTYDEAHSELRRKIAMKAGERSLSVAKTTAINVGGYALKKTLGELLKITIVELIKEFKVKSVDPVKERFKRVAKRIKKQLSHLVKTFKESALNNFVSTIIDAVMNVFLDTTKKIFKIIRMLWKPLLNAMKVIVSPSKEYSFTDKLLAASKIIGAALMGVLGVFLDEIINTALCSIPGVAILAPYVSPVLSALIVGMVSAIVIQGYSAYRKSQQLVEYKDKEGHIAFQLELISQRKAIIEEYKSVYKGISFANDVKPHNYEDEFNKSVAIAAERGADSLSNENEIEAYFSEKK